MKKKTVGLLLIVLGSAMVAAALPSIVRDGFSFSIPVRVEIRAKPPFEPLTGEALERNLEKERESEKEFAIARARNDRIGRLRNETYAIATMDLEDREAEEIELLAMQDDPEARVQILLFYQDRAAYRQKRLKEISLELRQLEGGER